jgi:hypothetical protein
VTAPGPLDRLRVLLAEEASNQALAAIAARAIALGWATVELDRAAAEVGEALGIPREAFVDAPPTAALGARCRVANDVLPGGLSLALLEPATEGRLAATLARLGEGPAAIWLAAPDVQGAVAALRATGVVPSIRRAGPFGDERLLLDGSIHGPHRLLVGLPGTIRA